MKQRHDYRLQELHAKKIDMSETQKNLVEQINFGCSLVTNLNLYYQQADITTKQKLIGSMFPEKLIFENGLCRTTKENEFIKLCGVINRELQNQKTGQTFNVKDLSRLVVRTGIEPVLPE